jgi:hypothetical protein
LALNEASIQTLEVCFIYLLYLYLIRFFYWIMNVLYAFRQESPLFKMRYPRLDPK